MICTQDGDDNDTKTALAMYAKDGEYVEFPGPCDCNGQVRVPTYIHTNISDDSLSATYSRTSDLRSVHFSGHLIWPIDFHCIYYLRETTSLLWNITLISVN